MKLFDTRQCETAGQAGEILHQAYAHAAAGGQALHVWICQGGWPKAPRVFTLEANAGRPWAHLFDQDPIRLAQTARSIGVKRIVISRQGERSQHIDLCGKPLERAISAHKTDLHVNSKSGEIISSFSLAENTNESI